MTMKTRLAVVVSLALITPPSLIYAAENNDKNGDVMVVTAAGFSQEKRDASATISVIDQKKLQIRSHQNITEAFQDIPGVLVGNGHGSLATGNVQMRGLDSDYTSYLVDGVKQNTAQSRPYGHHLGTEAYFMPPMAAIERIEVIRGPMSSLYGSDAMGGVVNVITRKAYAQENWTGALEDNYFLQEQSEYGNTNQINAFAMGPLVPGKLGLSVGADWLDRRDDDSPTKQRFVKHNSKNVNATLSLAATDTQLWDLNIVGGNQAKSHNKSHPWFWDFERQAFTLSQHAWYGDDLLEAKNYISYEKADTQYRTSTISPQYIKQNNFTATTQNTFSLDTHKLTLGASFIREELDDTFDIEHKQATGVTPVSEISRDGWAVFAEDAWLIVPDFTLTTSARLDHDSYFGYHVTPKLYGNWTIDESWALKGGVSSGYRKPELRQTSEGFTSVYGSSPPYPGIVIGNAALKPEKSINTELGLYWQGEGVTLDGTVFYTQFKDKISDDNICTETATQACFYNGYSAKTVDKYFNVSDANVYGLELNGDWQITPTLKANANYTWTRSEQNSGLQKGYALNDFPKHMENVSLNWSATSDLVLWTKANYRSDSPNTGKSTATESYIMVDLGARYHITSTTQLMAGIYNLFDVNPLYTTSYNQTSMVEGRRYNLGARVEF